MGNRLTLIMTVAVLSGFVIILLMNLASVMGYIPPKYIAPNDVRGMAIEHNKVLYTLNFEQQNVLVDIFNRAIPVTKEAVDARKTQLKTPFGIQKIIIYRFNNAPDIEIIPVAFVNKSTSAIASDKDEHGSMVFSAPQWNQDGLLEESVSDEIHRILNTTYDP